MNESILSPDNFTRVSNTSFDVNNSIECEVISEDEDHLLSTVNWWMEGVSQITIATAGGAGNIICIFLLSRKELNNSFNQLLICLASFDLVYLLGMMLESFQRLHVESRLHTLLYPHVLYPLNAIAMSGSIYMTVAIAMERYIAVYHPLDYNRVMQDSSSHVRRLLCYLTPVLLLAVCFNIPKFLESKVIYNTTIPHNANSSQVDMFLWILPGEPLVDITDLRLDPNYVTYYHNWARLLVLGIVPMSAIAILNLKIYLAMSRRRGPRRGNEDSFTIVLMFIVVTFIVCNLPRVILNMHEVRLMDKIKKCFDIGMGGFPIWSILLGFFSHILLVINSSANLFIYCTVGAKFKEVAFNYFARIVTIIFPFLGEKFQKSECNCGQSTQTNRKKCRSCGKTRMGLSTFKSVTPSQNAECFQSCDASNEKILRTEKKNGKVGNGEVAHHEDEQKILIEKSCKILIRPPLKSQLTVEDHVIWNSDDVTDLKLEQDLPSSDLVVAEVETLEIQEGCYDGAILRRSVAPSITELIVIDPTTEDSRDEVKETAF